MKKAIVFLFLCLAGIVGFAACAELDTGEAPPDITMSEKGQDLQSGDSSCQTSSGDPCFCGTAGCDGEPGGGTGGGTGGAGGGGGGAEPYGYSQCGVFANLIPGQGYGGPAHPWCLYIPQKRRCCDYSTIGTPMGCYDEYRCYDGP